MVFRNTTLASVDLERQAPKTSKLPTHHHLRPSFAKAMFALLCFFLLGCARFAKPADLGNGGAAPYFSQPSSVFLLAGQSNMAGRGGVVNDVWDGHVPAECRPSGSVLRLSPAMIWEAAKEPIHLGIDVNKTVGIGPGMAFANAVLRKDSGLGVIGLVPCAAGGTNISEWGRGGHLYTRLIRRGEAAARGGATIQAMLWYQGESDTVNLEDAKKYRTRLRRFFNHVRSDLELPTLPIIQVALATQQGPYIDEVREAQFRVDLPNVKTIDAKGLQAGPDYLHLTTASQVQLGQMLAEAFLERMPLRLQTSSASRRHPSFVSGFLCRPFR
nr:probable carbohydrate esterase At4g34215 [Ipomoea trifida]